jgi:hypothetical protein
MCVKELTTQHHGGAGHGCIRSEETLAMAVFASTDTRAIDGVKKLAGTAFKSKQLKRGEASLARQSHTTLATFCTEVVVPKHANGDTFEGVTICQASVLRGLTVPLPGNPSQRVRAVCVLDQVALRDHDGHAALEYCEDLERLITNPNTLGRMRVFIGLDIATAFSELRNAADIFSP